MHNTHIANRCGKTIKAVLIDASGYEKEQIIENNKFKCIPTEIGTVRIQVYPLRGSIRFDPKPERQYASESDISYIVENTECGVNLCRSVYGGDIWQEDTGYRTTTRLEGTKMVADQVIYYFEKIAGAIMPKYAIF